MCQMVMEFSGRSLAAIVLGITGVAKAACLNAPSRAGARRSAMRKGQGFQAATL